MMTSEDYRERQAQAMSEEELDANVMDAARRFGFTLGYHTFDSRRSDIGFPDRILVSVQQKRVLWIEEKREGKEPAPYQAAWIAALLECGQEAYIIRPSDWYNGMVERLLRTKP